MSIVMFGGRVVQVSPLAWKAQSALDPSAGLTLGESAAIRRVLDQVLTMTPPAAQAAPHQRSVTLADIVKEHIHSLLESAGWRIRGAGGAAERLGLKPSALDTHMAKRGLNRQQRA